MLYGADDSRVKRSTRSCWAGGALGGPAVLIQHTAVRLPGRLACTAVPSAICLIDATRSTPAGNDAGRATDHQRRRSSRHSVTQPETATVCGTVCTAHAQRCRHTVGIWEMIMLLNISYNEPVSIRENNYIFDISSSSSLSASSTLGSAVGV